MTWEVEYTNEFADWWETLLPEQQDDITSYVQLLEEKGTQLPFPYSSKLNNSKHSHMRELRVQSSGNPLRILYAFDPRRTAILLIGGDKTGNDRFYDIYIPIADRLYDEYLQELEQEGLI
ncbi:MAG: addiction module toxin RelE [Kamptonema sp. SIO4C4]|nr:addiction module toxin RelE [Kamptonema sp. SIO4C4]